MSYAALSRSWRRPQELWHQTAYDEIPGTRVAAGEGKGRAVVSFRRRRDKAADDGLPASNNGADGIDPAVAADHADRNSLSLGL